MTQREQIKHLKDEIGYRDFRIAALQKKIQEQEEELKKIPRIKGESATLRKKNIALKEENKRLQQELNKKSEKHKVVGFRSGPQMSRVEELENQLENARIDNIVDTINSKNKIAKLQSELELTKKGLIHISPYGEVPKEIYDQIRIMDQDLSIAEANYESTKLYHDSMLKLLVDEGKKDRVEEYLQGYFPKRRGARKKISRAQIETMQKLREGGMSIRSIAETVGVSVGSVHRYLSEDKPESTDE